MRLKRRAVLTPRTPNRHDNHSVYLSIAHVIQLMPRPRHVHSPNRFAVYHRVDYRHLAQLQRTGLRDFQFLDEQVRVRLRMLTPASIIDSTCASASGVKYRTVIGESEAYS